jgi:hypothetical protein
MSTEQHPGGVRAVTLEVAADVAAAVRATTDEHDPEDVRDLVDHGARTAELAARESLEARLPALLELEAARAHRAATLVLPRDVARRARVLVGQAKARLDATEPGLITGGPTTTALLRDLAGAIRDLAEVLDVDEPVDDVRNGLTAAAQAGEARA